jgi:hypothetical protein
VKRLRCFVRRSTALVTAAYAAISCLAVETIGPVSSAAVASVLVSPAAGDLAVGETMQLTATLKDSAGNPLTGPPVRWESSDITVATVSNAGLVTGVAPGAATITAASEGTDGSAAIAVTVIPVAAVAVWPPSSSIAVGLTLQLTATPTDGAGNPLQGRLVTWASSSPSVATVSPSGLATGVAQGSATITATSEGKSGSAPVTVLVPQPFGVTDPTLLPLASEQLPNVVAYTTLNVPSQPAGFSYRDPVTNIRIWKVTSSTVPAANAGAGHEYSDGPNEVSLGWGPNNNTHTLLIRSDQFPYYVVDFTRGVGFSNYRQLPVQPRAQMLTATFSNLPGQERILYIMTKSQIVRFNTATMQLENTGNFPLNQVLTAWLQHDKNDVWFSGLVDATTAFAWNSQTNQYLTHAESWLNEARLERDGRYIALTNTNSTIRLWDLATNTFGPTQSDRLNIWLGHNANLRGQWVTTDVAANQPFDLDRYYPSGGQIAKTRFLNNSAGAGVHHSGNWVQSDADLGGDLNRQWSFVSGIDTMWPGVIWMQGIGVVRSDGSDARLLLHHYSVHPTYYADPYAQPSPDGKVVIFNSNMSGSGRYDLFVAEVPLR